MDFLSGAFKMLDGLNPMSKLMDVAGDALGLPPELKNAIKIGAGVATGNVMMIASGAMGAAQDVARHASATTEYPAGQGGGSGGAAAAGYAPSAAGAAHAGGSSQAGKLDPSILDFRSALRTLSSSFEIFDTLAGSNNDKFDLGTLAKVRGNLKLPGDLREAAGFLLDHTHYRNQLDTAHKGGRVDGTISLKDVHQALRNVEKAIAQHGVRENCAPPKSPPPACGTPAPSTPPPPVCGTPAPTTPAPPSCGTPGTGNPGGGGSPLDPEIHDYRSALRTLEANFPTLDGAAGGVDTRISLDELRSMAHDLRLSPELRSAAQFLTTNPGYFERLDTAGGNDNLIDLGGVRSELGRVDADLRKYGAPARPGSGSLESGGSGGSGGGSVGSGGSAPSSGVRSTGEVGDILKDPNLSLEEKIQQVLAQLMENSDEEIVKTMDDLAAAQDKQAGIKNTPDNQKALKDAERNAEQIKMRLQNLIEKRKAMFDLMSNMSSKFHEMAKTAISNLGRA